MKLYYIKERENPQLDKPYFVALGQLTKKDAAKHSKTLYGRNIIHSYTTEGQYSAKLNKIKADGFSLHYE